MKNLIIVFLILLVGILSWRACKDEPSADPTPITKAAKDRVDLDVEIINKTIGDKGFQSALIDDAKQVIGSSEELTDSSQIELDSVKRLLKIKDRQLISYTQVASRTIDSLMKAKNYGDSVFRYDGEYAKISFNLPKETFSLQYDAKVNMAEYWKRDWFLAPKKRYVEIWMADSLATINGLKRLRYEGNEKNIALKISGEGEYNGLHQEIYLGPSVGIESKRLMIEGRYLYHPPTQKWFPGFRIGYKILEF